MVSSRFFYPRRLKSDLLLILVEQSFFGDIIKISLIVKNIFCFSGSGVCARMGILDLKKVY
jgi:hypothetical protein